MDLPDEKRKHLPFRKERIIKEDGRYLIYYWFDSRPESEAKPNSLRPEDATAHEARTPRRDGDGQ